MESNHNTALPRLTRHLLGHGQLRRLTQGVQLASVLDKQLREQLTQSQNKQLISIALQGNQLVLNMASSAGASKLRFMQSQLLSHARKTHPGIISVRIKLAAAISNPSLSAQAAGSPKARSAPLPRLSNNSARSLTDAAQGFEDSPLKLALLKLSQNQ